MWQLIEDELLKGKKIGLLEVPEELEEYKREFNCMLTLKKEF